MLITQRLWVRSTGWRLRWLARRVLASGFCLKIIRGVLVGMSRDLKGRNALTGAVRDVRLSSRGVGVGLVVVVLESEPESVESVGAVGSVRSDESNGG